MKEILLNVNRNDFALSAVVTVPEVLAPQKPMVVVANSGRMHRVGTCRSTVTLARLLAREGYLCCRVDLSSFGDSAVRTDRGEMTDDQRIVQELQAVVDEMEALYGARPVVVYGLCTGSQNGFKLAVVDSRIVGLVGVDHFGFRNWSYYLVHYLRQATRLEPWLNRFQKMFGRTEAPKGEVIDLGGGGIEWVYPPLAEVNAGYQKLADRGVRMTYIWTGDWGWEYNHKQQFFLMHKGVDFKNMAEIHLEPSMSHILAEPASQLYVQQKVLEMMKKVETS